MTLRNDLGTLSYPVQVQAVDSGLHINLTATVDASGAYTTLPGRVLRGLGVELIAKRRFVLADGRRMDMEISSAWATIDGDSEVTLVVFGDDDAPSLLGTYTLEGLGLAVDPTSQRLVPTHLIMY